VIHYQPPKKRRKSTVIDLSEVELEHDRSSRKKTSTGTKNSNSSTYTSSSKDPSTNSKRSKSSSQQLNVSQLIDSTSQLLIDSTNDDDFVSDEWQELSSTFAIKYGLNHNKLKAKPTPTDIKNLVSFIDTTVDDEEKEEAKEWLEAFFKYIDKNPENDRKMRARNVKAVAILNRSDVESASPNQNLKQKKGINNSDVSSTRMLSTSSNEDATDSKPFNRNHKLLTPECIAAMKNKFERSFRRHYDKEDNSDRR